MSRRTWLIGGSTVAGLIIFLWIQMKQDSGHLTYQALIGAAVAVLMVVVVSLCLRRRSP